MPENPKISVAEKRPAEDETLGVPGLRAQIDKLRRAYPELEDALCANMTETPSPPAITDL